ncbi:hypothetical protein [Hoylesella buccalis]|uniref:hypothetical protein n=1 Tax=Hoylesella buccalis TaxID=28127 RepID=UPI0026ED037A|nr:hypothetical protein [Hoylesella buccalis]
MMRGKALIVSLWLAMLMVLLVLAVPHHHHLSNVCFVEERCETDGQINDRHTQHQPSGQESQADNCPVEQIRHIVKDDEHVQPVIQVAQQQPHWLCGNAADTHTHVQIVSPVGETSEPIARLLEAHIASSGRRGPPALS